MKNGIYRHYKGALYRVTGTGRHTETEQDFVIYHSISSPDQIWLRPTDMFAETVTVNDVITPRFECISS